LREVGVSETPLSVATPRSLPPGSSVHQSPESEHEGHEPAPDYENLCEPSPDDESATGPAERRAPKSGSSAGVGDLRHSGLMTGADLLAAAESREPPSAGGFTVGMSARHPRYGVGKVVKISGVSRNRLITIQFDDDGRTETFVAGKNPLQPVGAG
jgi:hypothetical protein